MGEKRRGQRWVPPAARKVRSGSADRAPTRLELEFMRLLASAGSGGVTLPRAEIMGCIGCTRRSFMLLCRRLSQSGLIVVICNYTTSGRQLENTYRLTPSGMALVRSCGW